MRSRRGRPLVLIHGFIGSPVFWQPLLAELPRELARRALTPTVCGHGTPNYPAPPAPAPEGSTQPGPDSFNNEVDRLAEWIREHRDQPSKARQGSQKPLRNQRPGRKAKIDLVGYSQGGRLALGLLTRHQQLFRRAVIIGTHPGLSSAEDRRRRREADETWAQLLETEGLEAFLNAWEALPHFSTQTPEQRASLRAFRQHLDPVQLARALRAVGLGAMPDHRPLLPTVEVPVTLVAGELDTKFTALAHEMEDLLPRGAAVVIPGTGHNPVLEAPRAIARLITGSRHG
ncbi:MAG: alpha/beta fold hydrolase [Acidobacteriota bacterium]|nr:alpha/beta fold hydrolase [Acidobacteriota bacterium]